MSSQTRTTAARLRERLLSQPIAEASKIEIDGETFFIRTALMADRTKVGVIAGLAPKLGKDGDVDIGVVRMDAMTAAALIVLAVDEVGTPLCTEVDLEALIATPAGGWVQQLGEACLKKINGAEKKEPASAATPAVASPSSSPTV